MRSSYDVIVVGAGPAGSVAARKFAAAGFSVLLIEKRQEIGVPVRCAEAIGAEITRPYIDINPRWIDATISHYAICNANGDRVIVPPSEPTLVVNRKVFDWELAHLAAQAGAEVRVHSTATHLLRVNGHVAGVHVESLGQDYDVRARLVIAADGTESQVARWAGLATIPPLADYYVGLQYLLGSLKGLDPTVCAYYLGSDIAPGGYAWVFPKGEDTANVGLVISGSQARASAPPAFLDAFVERRFPNASLLGVVAGGIPATGALKKMVTDGLMVVGDAAHQADPLTAGGINLGMIGADLAAQVGTKALATGDVSAHALGAYEQLWHDRFSAQHSALYQVRKLLTDMDDAHLSGLIRTAAQLPITEMSLGEILLALLKHQPRLLLEASKLIATGLILK